MLIPVDVPENLNEEGVNMKNKILAVVNQKGGVGKTTTVLTLAAGLTRLGYRVLVVDLDSQMNLTWQVTGKTDFEATSADMLITEDSKISRALVKTPQGDIIPSSRRLAGVDSYLNKIKALHPEQNLKNSLKAFERRYDFVLIDTAPSLNLLTINALTSSDSCVITAECDVSCMQGIGQVLKTIQSCKAFNPGLSIAGILLCKYRGRTILCRDMTKSMRELAGRAGTKVFKTTIRESNLIRESQALRKSIFDYKPRSTVAQDYKAWIEELLGGMSKNEK